MKMLLTLIALCLIGTTCFSQTISADDKLHFGAGAVISGSTYAVVYSVTKNKKKAFWYSLGASTIAGLTKEVYDSGKENNKFDTGEWVATTAGRLTISTTLELFVGKRKNKKQKNIVLVN